MSITANAGPYVSFGQGTAYDYNPEAGPSAFYQGVALLDPRAPFTYNPGQDFGAATCGFLGADRICVLNITPAAATVDAIAAAANVVSGTAMTLVSSSGAGITVGASVTNYNTGQSVTGLLAIGGAAGRTSFGSSGTIQLWNPTTLTARCVSVTGSSSSTGGNITVAGYDIYGVPMTETIAAPAGASTVNGKKAFKYIASVTPAFTDAHNYSVGLLDLFGLPLRADYAGEISANYNATGITTLTTFVAAVTTTATATTGDVRGTIGVPSATDASKRLIVYVSPSLANIYAGATGLFGVTQA